jgi:hypothetical protein
MNSNNTAYITVKFKQTVDISKSLKELLTYGISGIFRLFPEESDKDLSRIYILEVDIKYVDKTIRELQYHKMLEYVERTPIRKTK